MQRLWKPLDVGGLRLYEVVGSTSIDHLGRNDRRNFIVAADSPTHAAELVKACGYTAGWTVQGRALSILMPSSWWNEGTPFLSLVNTDTTTPLIDHFYCKHQMQMCLASSSGSGEGSAWDESVWLCRDCGRFESRVWRNSQRSIIHFFLATDSHIRAAVRYAQYRSSRSNQPDASQPLSEISNYEI